MSTSVQGRHFSTIFLYTIYGKHAQMPGLRRQVDGFIRDAQQHLMLGIVVPVTFLGPFSVLLLAVVQTRSTAQRGA